jgi:hypothetical protein
VCRVAGGEVDMDAALQKQRREEHACTQILHLKIILTFSCLLLRLALHATLPIHTCVYQTHAFMALSLHVVVC